MFCSRCGKQATNDAKYCCVCGNCLQSGVPESSKEGTGSAGTSAGHGQQSRKTPTNTVSFQQFLKRKADSRKEHFKVKKYAKKEQKDVTVNIGVMRYVNGTLKSCRGRNLPLSVSPEATREVILERAVEKHANHDRNMLRGIAYALLYPDGTEVETLPGSSDLFVLSKYKDEIGKSFSRVTLYIAPKSDITDATLDELSEMCVQELSSDDESSGSGKELLVPTLLAKTPQTSKNEGEEVNIVKDGEYAHATREESNLKQVECPVCCQYFPLATIADHADSCVDMWIGEVEDEATPSSTEVPENPPPTAEETFTDNTSIGTASINSPDNLHSILEELRQQHLSEKEVRVSIRRRHIWLDFKQARKKFNITPRDKIRVVFLGEPAVDEGGPRREFFSEMLAHTERKLFVSGKPVASTVTLLDGDFKMAGELMVMSILQGGPAPNFLDSCVFEYLVKQPLCPKMLSTPYREVAVKMQEAPSHEILREVLMSDEGLDILQEIGYKGVPQRETISSSCSIVQSICIKTLLEGCMPQIMQLEEGLSACNVLTSSREHPALWKSVFVPGFTVNITPEEFLDQLVVQFSLSERCKEAEIDVYKYFCDFIQASEHHESGGTGFSIPAFLKWLTGCSGIPPLGYGKKFNLGFIHGCQPGCQCRPTASTCDLLVKLPVHINSEQEMEAMLLSALSDCYGFGLI